MADLPSDTKIDNNDTVIEERSPAITDDIQNKDARTIRFQCKTLNPQTKCMLEFVLSTYMNFVDYNLERAHNFSALPEFLSSEMSFYDSSAPLFIKELLDVLFGRETKISSFDGTSVPRAIPPTNRLTAKQISLVDTINNGKCGITAMTENSTE